MQGEICVEQFATWSDERCAEVWSELEKTYVSGFTKEWQVMTEKVTTHRRYLEVFAKYANGVGRTKIEKIQRRLALTAEYEKVETRAVKLFHIMLSEISATGRCPRVVAARQFITHIMREKGLSYPDIAVEMKGRKNHSAIFASHQRIQTALEQGDTFEVWIGGRFTQMAGPEIIERLTQ